MSNNALQSDSAMRAIPSVDQLLKTEAIAPLRKSVGMPRLRAVAREVAAELRNQIQAGLLADNSREALTAEAVQRIQSLCSQDKLAVLRRVINATGVVLHTNLGRAPLSAAARQAVSEEAAGYCTLEYDPSLGARGKRGARVEELLIELTGAEGALVVNNCAAAALLILTVLAADGATIVSRGELVEIGGDFRVPDVMSNSGTRMVEVGSTNRTRLEDYRNAINESTRLVMRVHPSNYRIVGFTDAPPLDQLAALAHDSGLVLYEDAGSGVLNDLSTLGITDEPIIRESVAAGCDVISFSGDKLLGATQAGVIVGRREIIDRLRSHSLYRALRVDKLSLAALEITLEAHRRGAVDEIPVLRMLSLSKAEIETRARNLLNELQKTETGLKATIIAGESAVGGGSAPSIHPETALLALEHERISADELERQLRFSNPPVIARIANNLVLVDLRTVDPDEEHQLLDALLSITG
jgi:L-seryl-tRNA(Ser) seleniumtransferase